MMHFSNYPVYTESERVALSCQPNFTPLLCSPTTDKRPIGAVIRCLCLSALSGVVLFVLPLSSYFTPTVGVWFFWFFTLSWNLRFYVGFGSLSTRETFWVGCFPCLSWIILQQFRWCRCQTAPNWGTYMFYIYRWHCKVVFKSFWLLGMVWLFDDLYYQFSLVHAGSIQVVLALSLISLYTFCLK